MLGRSVRDDSRPGDLRENSQKNIDACFQGKAVQFEMRNGHSESGERDLLLRYFPVENPEGITRDRLPDPGHHRAQAGRRDSPPLQTPARNTVVKSSYPYGARMAGFWRPMPLR